MADIKISELQETTSLDGFYVPGVKETSGSLDSKKFELSGFQDDISKAISSVQSGIETFNSDKNYYTGEYVIYGTDVWRFVDIHSAGAWTGTDATQVSVYSELENLMTSENESVHINVSSSDNLLNPTTVTVTLNLSNGTTLQQVCDPSGNCDFTVTIGLEYTIVMADKAGYQSIGDAIYTAEITNRYINIVYQELLENQTCDVTVNFSVYNGGSVSDFNNLTCYLYRDSTPIGPQTITNGVATFTGLTKGVSYSTGIPTNSRYVKPSDKTFIAYDNTGVNFSYKFISQDGFGIFLVYTVTNDGEIEYREIELSALFDGDSWKGKDADDNTINLSNTVAFHIYPEILANNGYDYFIKPSDLCTRTTKQWSSSNVSYTDVPMSSSTQVSTNYNGKLYTYYMAYDSRVKLNITSAAADWVVNQTLQYKGKTLHGFIGSVSQLNFIFPLNYNTNKENIYRVLSSLGLTPNYAGQSWWSSVQSYATLSWNWTGSTFTSTNKTYSGGVLPFFAI